MTFRFSVKVGSFEQQALVHTWFFSEFRKRQKSKGCTHCNNQKPNALQNRVPVNSHDTSELYETVLSYCAERTALIHRNVRQKNCERKAITIFFGPLAKGALHKLDLFQNNFFLFKHLSNIVGIRDGTTWGMFVFFRRHRQLLQNR